MICQYKKPAAKRKSNMASRETQTKDVYYAGAGRYSKMLAAARKQAKNPIASLEKTVYCEKEDCTGSDG